MLKGNNVDYFSKICRICGSEDVELMQLKTSIGDSTVSLMKMITKTFHMDIAENDGLPQNICLKCLKVLNIAYDFVNKATTTRQSCIKILTEEKLASASANTVDQTKARIVSIEVIEPCSLRQNVAEEIIDGELVGKPLTNDYPTTAVSPERRIVCLICQKLFLTIKALHFHQKIFHKNINGPPNQLNH